MSAESEKIKGGDVKKAVIMGVGAEQGLGSQLAKRLPRKDFMFLSPAELSPDLML